MEGQSSTALTAVGTEQSRQLAAALKAECLSDRTSIPTHLYTSPLLRAQQTAQVLTAELQPLDQPCQKIVDDRLQEIHQGIFQGLTWTEAQTQFPKLCTKLISTPNWHPVPGAESSTAARARARKWLTHILSTHRPGETLWIVSHAGFLLHLIAETLGCDRTWKTDISHTAVFEFWLADLSSTSDRTDLYNPEKWIVRRFNQVLQNQPSKSELPIESARPASTATPGKTA